MDPDRSGGGVKGDERELKALRAALGFAQPEAPPIFERDVQPREGLDRPDTSDETITAPVQGLDIAASVRSIMESLESVRAEVDRLGRRLDWVEQMVRAQAAQTRGSQDASWRRSSGA